MSDDLNITRDERPKAIIYRYPADPLSIKRLKGTPPEGEREGIPSSPGSLYFAGEAGGEAPGARTEAPEPVAAAPKPKSPKPVTLIGLTKGGFAALVVFIVIACLVSGAAGGWIGTYVTKGSSSVSGGNGADINITPLTDITTTEAVAKKVLPSVVGITTSGVRETSFFGQQEVSGVGSGMIIDEEGYILTNSHVVMDGEVNKIVVLLSTGEEVEGSVVWNDAAIDLAIVKINAAGLTPVEFANATDVSIGEYAAAIGNPLGLAFSGSITQGVVSGLDRTITVEGSGGAVKMNGLLQVDAAINSGNSGGPLLNAEGKVIGINTAKASAEGMGFAIPIDTAMPIIEQVIETGGFQRVYMGISAADVSTIAESYPNIKLSVSSGAYVTQITPGSPAEAAGISVQDVITEVDGRTVKTSDDLIKILLNYSEGDKVMVVFDRGGKEMETEVTLSAQ
ncbi:MAG: trypsin-like peptidase domain-containing protein [Clostridiales Family XIII bacterium]|jgi:S1-C subfamily serine protease|nr:trypsin-like peptidase domain-containing protein [Clostridiales Family XIII bacterium]